MNEHLKRLLDAADAADRGETIDVTDETLEEYIARLMKQAPVELANEVEATGTKPFDHGSDEEIVDWLMSPVEIGETSTIPTKKIFEWVNEPAVEERELWSYRQIEEWQTCLIGSIPNAETITAMEDTDLARYDSLADMFAALDAEPSREQPLQELLKEFEDCLENMLRLMSESPGFDVEGYRRVRDIEWYAAHLEGYYYSRHAEKVCSKPVIEKARRYIIARDFNEFDPLRADMLWKLQYP